MSCVLALVALVRFRSRHAGGLGLAAMTETLASLYLWLALTVVLLMVLGLVGAIILKRVRTPPDTGFRPAFSLADLRRLRDQGELTEQEYLRAKSRVLSQMAAAGDAAASKNGCVAAAKPPEDGPAPTIR